MYINWEEIWPHIVAFLAAYLIVGAVWLVLQIVAWWRIFTKAGEPGWKSLIPIYNTYIQFKIAWDPQYFWTMIVLNIGAVIVTVIGALIGSILAAVASLLVTVASVATAIINITLLYRLSQAFGHGVGFALGLLFLQPIFILILGLGGDQYQGNFYAPRI